jgi:hypothetical protein
VGRAISSSFAPKKGWMVCPPVKKQEIKKLVVVKQYQISMVLRVSFDLYLATLLSISDWLPHELTAQDFFPLRCGKTWCRSTVSPLRPKRLAIDELVNRADHGKRRAIRQDLSMNRYEISFAKYQI